MELCPPELLCLCLVTYMIMHKLKYVAVVYVIILYYTSGNDLTFPTSEKLSFTEQYIMKHDVRYPRHKSLLEEINSSIEQQFDKVSEVIMGKMAFLNQELHRELIELPKKHDIAEVDKKSRQKATLEAEIADLKKNFAISTSKA